MFYQAPVHHLLQVTPPVFLTEGQSQRQWEDECGSHVLSYSCAVPGYRVSTQWPQQPGPHYGNQPSAQGSPAEQSRANEAWEAVGNKGMSPYPAQPRATLSVSALAL